MNQVVVAVISVAIVIIGVLAISSSDQSASKTNIANFATIQSDVASGAKLYDVRTSQEFTSGHFENATNWSLQEMQAGKFPDAAKDTKIYVYCQSGNRSSQATELLKRAGFSVVVDLGGISDLQNGGGKLR